MATLSYLVHLAVVQASRGLRISRALVQELAHLLQAFEQGLLQCLLGGGPDMAWGLKLPLLVVDGE